MMRLINITLIAAMLAGVAPAAEPAPAGKGPATADIYDRKADGNKQISAALAVARRDNKRVLLQFGANWCGWCHKLHALLKSDTRLARTMLYEYELVLIDVDTVDGKKHNSDVDAKFGNPCKLGLPALVILDATGKQLTTQDSGKLEEGDHHDPAKVQALLDHWKAPAQDADKMLADGLARAKKESKAVLLHFGAPWCGWCHRFEAFLYRDDVNAVMSTAFVDVKIDVDRMTGGKEMNVKYRSAAAGAGIPFFAVLDADGKKIGESVGPTGNIGHPTKPAEIRLFLDIVKKAKPTMTSEQLEILEKALKA